ncbi:MAG: GatB/YqeY domain-containing protein [Anaerolineales bacterium]|nr:GatB/YqeY domain-containing protein [Anaerolineales bacterium]
MSLKQKLTDDMKTAMRTGDTQKRDTLRMLLAAVKQTEIDDRTTLDDAGVQAVLTKQAKQRRESIADYEKAGRAEMVAEEAAELAVIESYLPQMMSAEAVRAEAQQVIAELGVTDVKGMGQVMSQLMPRLKGQADGRVVSAVVRELLQR